MKLHPVISCLLLGFVASIVFPKQHFGLNLLIFDTLLLALLLSLHSTLLRHTSFKIVLGGFILSLAAVLITNTAIGFCMHTLFLLLICGQTLNSPIKNPLYMLASAFEKLPALIAWPFKKSTVPKKSPSPSPVYVFRVTIIPLLIIIAFVFLYALAVPRFLALLRDFITEISEIFPNLSAAQVGYFLLGIIVAAMALYVMTNNYAATADASASDTIVRTRKKGLLISLTRALQKKHTSAIILLAGLNILIALINSLDMATYWFSYTPANYETMKQLVHEGTYLLIFCVLLSTFIIVYLYSNNLNFLKQNRLLKNLAILWLAQNILMIISVAWRNYWYIQSYNLAYKRIGVLIFLLATIVGIATVIIKVNNKKSMYYLLRVNTSFVIGLLLAVSFINWDYIITNYNLAHKNTAYIHKNFLVDMDASALPVLAKHIEVFDTAIDYEHSYKHIKNSVNDSATYIDYINQKKKSFLQRYATQSWLSWNLKDQQTFAALQQ